MIRYIKQTDRIIGSHVTPKKLTITQVVSNCSLYKEV